MYIRQKEHRYTPRSRSAFTIVELLIVIVVIAILAGVVVVSYRGITDSAETNALKSELQTIEAKLARYKTKNTAYPASLSEVGEADGGDLGLGYWGRQDNFCVSANKNGKQVYLMDGNTFGGGACPQAPAIAMQVITGASCPATRTLVYDARDNNTYWVQKLADGKCWMLTNLAYAGGVSSGGSTAYNDIKTLTNGTSDGSQNFNYALAKYYIPPSGSNVTVNPNTPSISTDGGVSNPQYGYLYNWCAAMGAQNGVGGQPSTAVCANATVPTPDATVSICPSGWRLPTGTPASGELALFASAIGATPGNGSVQMRSIWLTHYSGAQYAGFNGQGSYAKYWSSTPYSSGSSAHHLEVHTSGSVITTSANIKVAGFAVRCVAV